MLFRWGCAHETTAVRAYLKNQKHHNNLTVAEAGFTVDLQNPFFGASTDGRVQCSCCKHKVILEVKCPFCVKSQSLQEAAEKNANFCLQIDQETGQMTLKKNHAYYFQVQGQLLATKADYCDFIVWSPNNKLHVQRIAPDVAFIADIQQKLHEFIIHSLLPELLAKWTTRQCSNIGSEPSVHVESWCYCRKGEEGEMVRCGGSECEVRLFHLRCTRLTRVPKRKWLCQNCSARKRSHV